MERTSLCMLTDTRYFSHTGTWESTRSHWRRRRNGIKHRPYVNQRGRKVNRRRSGQPFYWLENAANSHAGQSMGPHTHSTDKDATHWPCWISCTVLTTQSFLVFEGNNRNTGDNCLVINTTGVITDRSPAPWLLLGVARDEL